MALPIDLHVHALSAFGLDISGFQWVNCPSVENEFANEERIKTVYYAEVESILKMHAGAKSVFIFDHTIRSSYPETKPVRLTWPSNPFASAERKVGSLLPEDAERLLKGGYQVISVWRPIANKVAHNFLGVVDFCAVNVDAYLVPYNPKHEWYYLSDQTPDEMTLLKCFDSDTDEARLTPHSAFLDKTSPADAPQTQSIEIMALVFDRE